ncbi:MULE transposase [Hirsutella rhossiliensis]|uniref:MULE transposase domain-containing protein n=1 Tax=Hirsutella rhossiliensis TaxID=111463 RepID=A0A9P8N8E0_9HYPO|nr:MULE transposase domain-containing protein [Hirsutella rhossiliensis]KAH0968725.1 MULE transposase domain-containing protein [Hirsutella rhossiliensis]
MKELKSGSLDLLLAGWEAAFLEPDNVCDESVIFFVRKNTRPTSAAYVATIPPDFDHDDLRDSEHWNGQPWEVIFPSDSPLLNTTYETAELAFDALKDLCIRNRMGLVTLRSQKNKANTRTIKYELVCDKSRSNPRESVAKIRNTNTTKLASNCPFKVIIQSLQANNYEWSMRIVSSLHRAHGPSEHLTEHYHWRKLTEEQDHLLEELCLDKTISCRSIHKQLRQKWPKIPIRRTDIYNWRWTANKAKRQGYGPTNDFVRTLSESKRVWIWGLDWIEDECRFRHAAWGYHKGGKMWQQFSSCLQIDATYNVNCYKMPLVTVVTVSSERTSMPICYGLLNNEQFASFEWFLQQLSRFRRAGNISPPEVIITDKDDQLRDAIRQIFPDTQLQLCVFHINSNVVLYIKKWWMQAKSHELDDDHDKIDALDIQEMERANNKVKHMKDIKLGPLPQRFSVPHWGYPRVGRGMTDHLATNVRSRNHNLLLKAQHKAASKGQYVDITLNMS